MHNSKISISHPCLRKNQIQRQQISSPIHRKSPTVRKPHTAKPTFPLRTHIQPFSMVRDSPDIGPSRTEISQQEFSGRGDEGCCQHGFFGITGYAIIFFFVFRICACEDLGTLIFAGRCNFSDDGGVCKTCFRYDIQ